MKDAHKGDGYGMSTEQDLELSNTKPVIWHHFQWLALAAILSLAFLLHVIPLTYSHFWDETVFLQNAMVLLDGRNNYDELDYRPPVLPLLYAAGFSVWEDIFIAHLVQAEWDDRYNRRLARLIAKARFRYKASMEEIDYTEKRNLDKTQILRLSSCDWITKNQNTILTGSTGLG